MVFTVICPITLNNYWNFSWQFLPNPVFLLWVLCISPQAQKPSDFQCCIISDKNPRPQNFPVWKPSSLFFWFCKENPTRSPSLSRDQRGQFPGSRSASSSWILTCSGKGQWSVCLTVPSGLGNPGTNISGHWHEHADHNLSKPQACRLVVGGVVLAISTGLTTQNKQNKMFSFSPLPHSHRILSLGKYFHTGEKNRIKRMSPFKDSVNGPGTALYPSWWSCLSYTRAAKPAGEAHVPKNMFILTLLSSALIYRKIRTESGSSWFLSLSPLTPTFPRWNLEFLVSTSPINFFFFKAGKVAEQVILCPREKSRFPAVGTAEDLM